MITLTIQDKKYSIPSKWDEVTDRNMFVRLCNAIFRYESGQTDFDQFKLEIVIAVLDLNISRTEISDVLGCNLYTLTKVLTFPYRIEETAKGIYVYTEICLNNNLLPEIGGIKGYKYETSFTGIIDADLTASQYSEAVDLLNFFTTLLRSDPEGALTILAPMFATLYPIKPHYTKKMPTVTKEEKVAMLYNFRGILESIRKDPDYDLIFRKAGHKSEPSPTGSQSAIFSLTKAGFGDVETVGRMGIHSFLSAMVQQTVDSIHTLQGSGMKPGKIAEKLNLTLDQVLQFTTITDSDSDND